MAAHTTGMLQLPGRLAAHRLQEPQGAYLLNVGSGAAPPVAKILEGAGGGDQEIIVLCPAPTYKLEHRAAWLLWLGGTKRHLHSKEFEEGGGEGQEILVLLLQLVYSKLVPQLKHHPVLILLRQQLQLFLKCREGRDR